LIDAWFGQIRFTALDPTGRIAPSRIGVTVQTVQPRPQCGVGQPNSRFDRTQPRKILAIPHLNPRACRSPPHRHCHSDPATNFPNLVVVALYIGGDPEPVNADRFGRAEASCERSPPGRRAENHPDRLTHDERANQTLGAVRVREERRQ
jgi:hypothetical protein